MPIEERRRLALHQHATTTWNEEVADTLLELVTPAGHELATRQDLDRLQERFDRRFERLEDRMQGFESRIARSLHELGERFERRIADAVTTQTRTLVLSQLGALVVIAALAFGLR